jgi:hypothetical protein
VFIINSNLINLTFGSKNKDITVLAEVNLTTLLSLGLLRSKAIWDFAANKIRDCFVQDIYVAPF